MHNKFLFIVVGVGGIGGAVARDLPKLIIGSKHKIVLVDGDVVEKNNTIRQPYQEQDVGLNKARALAKKINSFYDIGCLFLDTFITNDELSVLTKKYEDYVPVFIGCVDNDATRKVLESTFLKCKYAYYIDGANSEYDGNIYFSKIKNSKRDGPLRSEVYELQDDINPGTIGCEARLAKGGTQYFITNNKLASIMLQQIDSLIKNDEKFGVTIVERFKTLYY